MLSCIQSCQVLSDNLHSVNKPRFWRTTGFINGFALLAAIGLGMVAYLAPLRDWLADGELIRHRLALLGVAGPLVFTMAVAVLTVTGIPRLLLCSLGGMAFGFAWGLVWTQLGTLLGSYGVFLFIRWRGGAYALQQFPKIRKFSQQLEKRGLMSVMLMRQLPINGFYNNVLLALTPVKHGEFLLGSLLGFLPLGISACLLGAGLIQRDFFTGVQFIVFGLACSVIFGFICNRLIKKLSATRD